MLPSELLRIRIRKGVVRPAYVDGWKDRAVLEEVLNVFETAAHRMWRLTELDDRISSLSEVHDYRLVRGLARLLRRRITLAQESRISPRDLRRLLFSMGPVLSGHERARLLESVAARFEVTVEELEDDMFADIEGEKRVTEMKMMDAEQLAAWYNAELSETLIARSVRLIVRAGGLWATILRRVKRFGLMYDVIEEGGPGIEVTGPASVLRLTERYGRSAAELLPLLVEIGDWRLEGEIVLGARRRILPFMMKSSDASFRYPFDILRQRPRPFDSTVEERFYHALKQASPDLKITREPAPLKTGTGIMVPDFKIERGGRGIYVEIVGFWTPEYLRRKLEKLEKLETTRMMVLADRSLGLSRQRLGGSKSLLLYEGDLPIKAILEAVRNALGEGAVTKRVKEVKPELRRGLEELLEPLIGRSYYEVEGKLKPLLGARWLEIVESQGYTFDWRMLDVRRALLIRKDDKHP